MSRKSITLGNNKAAQQVPQKTMFFCEINKKKLQEVLNKILVHSRELDVFGYNKILDEYWGKKMCSETNTYINFNLRIYSNNLADDCIILIESKDSSSHHLKKIKQKIKEIINNHYIK